MANVATTANGSDASDVGIDALMETPCAKGDGQKMRDALGDIVTAIRSVIFLLIYPCTVRARECCPNLFVALISVRILW